MSYLKLYVFMYLVIYIAPFLCLSKEEQRTSSWLSTLEPSCNAAFGSTVITWLYYNMVVSKPNEIGFLYQMYFVRADVTMSYAIKRFWCVICFITITKLFPMSVITIYIYF